MQALNDDAPGAIETAASAAGGVATQAGSSAAELLRMGGRKVDLVAVRLQDGDFAGAADYLRAAADYIETAAALLPATDLAIAA